VVSQEPVYQRVGTCPADGQKKVKLEPLQAPLWVGSTFTCTMLQGVAANASRVVL